MMPPHPHQTAPQVPCGATHEQAAGARGHSSSQAGPPAGGRAGSPPPAWTPVSPRWAPWGQQGIEGLMQAEQGRGEGLFTSTLAVPLCHITCPSTPTPYSVPQPPFTDQGPPALPPPAPSPPVASPFQSQTPLTQPHGP